MCDNVYTFPLVQSVNLTEYGVTQSVRLHLWTLVSNQFLYKYISK
jgi:hypothetical protein